MKRLLRSVIDYDGNITQENLVFNFQKLSTARLEWVRTEDDKIYKFIQGYFQQHLEMPSVQTLLDYFSKDVETTERLKDLQSVQSYIRTNFTYLLQSLLEEQNKIKAIALLKEAHEIIARGLEIEGERKTGVKDGLMHFARRANELIVPSFTAKSQGDVRLDGQAMIDEYHNAEVNKGKTWGAFTGLAKIDEVCRGAKRGELWTHAAFPGELKTTFGVNWCYNLVTRFKTNVVYVSLEMPYEQIRRNIYTTHTANVIWTMQGFRPLDYRKIRDGGLSPEEKEFYFKHVIPDFCNNPNYTTFEIITPAEKEWNIDDIQMQLELLHKQFEVGFVVIDHGQWVEARKQKRSKDYVIELNSVVRDAKRLALHFNGRQGVPVLLLWQINREGKDAAIKNEGVYQMKALTYANEVEKTSDVITTTFLDKNHRDNGTTKFSCLKNRDNPIFDPFEARVDFISRRIRNFEVGEMQNDTLQAESIDIMSTLNQSGV